MPRSRSRSSTGSNSSSSSTHSKGGSSSKRSSISRILEDINNKNADRFSDSCIELNNMVQNNSKNVDKILKKGGLQALIKAMQSHVDDASAQTTAAVLLESLATACGDPKQRQQIALSGGAVTAILQAMAAQSGNCSGTSLCTQGSSSLTALCKESGEIKRAIVNFKSDKDDKVTGATLVVDMLQSHRNNAQAQKGCTLIRDLATVKVNHWPLVQAGAVRAVLFATKKHKNDQPVQAIGCAALANLMSSGNETTRQQMTNDKTNKYTGIELIYFAMKEFPSNVDIQTNACEALANIITGAPADTATEIADTIRKEGGLKYILKAMQRYPQEEPLQQAGCVALHAIVATQNHENRDYVAQRQGVSILINALRLNLKNEVLQRAGVSALLHLSNESVETKLEIATTGGIQVMHKAMKLYAIEDTTGVSSAS